MIELWKNYVAVFRKLITDGWIVVTRKSSCLYLWVYPYTSLPTKFRIKEAYEISNYADRYFDSAGTTRIINVGCSIFYDTRRCIWGGNKEAYGKGVTLGVGMS